MGKKIQKKNQHGKKFFHFYFIRVTFFIFLTILFYAGVSFFLKTPHLSCANSKTCTSDLTLHIDNNIDGMFHGKKVIPPLINSLEEPSTPVLGATSVTDEKHIYVDLAAQTLYAYQGKTLILKTLISSGKWGITPTGNFHIWEKLRATRMAGGEGDDAYDLPNVPYVMYFYSDFGLHGAYWHDNFGHPMSHGCVNMRQIDAKIIYDWADGPSDGKLGTAVSICDKVTGNHECIQNNPVQ